MAGPGGPTNNFPNRISSSNRISSIALPDLQLTERFAFGAIAAVAGGAQDSECGDAGISARHLKQKIKTKSVLRAGKKISKKKKIYFTNFLQGPMWDFHPSTCFSQPSQQRVSKIQTRNFTSTRGEVRNSYDHHTFDAFAAFCFLFCLLDGRRLRCSSAMRQEYSSDNTSLMFGRYHSLAMQ